jgi:hypothetical protein
LYSNVEGRLDARGRSDQQQWLAAELRAAPSDKKLLVAVHHPCYSLDGVHDGCPDILTAIDKAIVASDRRPDAVLSGHVHNYQRFSREEVPASAFVRPGRPLTAQSSLGGLVLFGRSER